MPKTTITKGSLEYRQFIILDDGTEVRVRYNQNPELYKGTDVPLFEYQAKEGKGENAKMVTRYAVEFGKELRATRTSVKETINTLMAQGLTADQIVAKLKG